MTSRTVVITGASTGIGEACALHLDRQGWSVFAGVRRQEDGQRLARQSSGRLRWVMLDVTDPAAIGSAVREVEAAAGEAGLDGLVNNAGIAVGGPLELVSMDRFRWQFEVNVFGLLQVTQAFLPLLRAARGRIVNIGSISGRIASPMVGPYCASKHALEAMTDTLRLELEPSGLRVSVIEPGVVVTPIWDKGRQAMDTELARVPAPGRERYDTLFRAFRRLVESALARGVKPEVVVRAIEHALTARRPRTRYVIGRDARIRLVAQTILPRRWMDALVQRVIRRAAGAG